MKHKDNKKYVKLTDKFKAGIKILEDGSYCYLIDDVDTFYVEPDTYSSHKQPIQLSNDDEIYKRVVKILVYDKKSRKTVKQVFEELQKILIDNNPHIQEEKATSDNIPHQDQTEATSDYMQSLFKKYDYDILNILDDNLPEYVGEKTNLAILILTIISVKCNLSSFIININGDSLAGKTTLIKTLFKIIPDDMIKNHNNSTLSGIIRESIEKKGLRNTTYYNNSLIYLGNITDDRKKQIKKIEQLTLSLYKEGNYISTMGSKSATENTMMINLTSDSFLSLTKSIKPYKSINQEINDITTYLTVTQTSKQELIEQLQLQRKTNNQEFIEKHKQYIDNLTQTDILNDFYSNKELIHYIIDNTSDLNYETLTKHEMLFISYCIYLSIPATIESYRKFQQLIPQTVPLTPDQEQLIDFIQKKHTNEPITLSSKNRKQFKYFSVENLQTYHSNIKAIKEPDDLNKTIEALLLKKILKKNSDGLFYLP